jgi:hypothetical protein
MIDAMIDRMTAIDEAFRAQRIVHAAGCPISPGELKYSLGDKECMIDMQKTHKSWWAGERDKWVENKSILEDARWRTLPPHLIAPPQPIAQVDVEDKRWKTDLELRAPQLKSFDCAFVVDATGSMGPAIAWLRRDVKRMMAALAIVSMEPRIGLTFYRDHGDEFVTRHLPLTGNVEPLVQGLNQTEAKGGEDIEEAVREGLKDSIKQNKWSKSSVAVRKVMVLVADAPPHADTQKDCETYLRDHAETGTRLYALKVRGPHAAPDQSALDKLAEAGKGSSLEGSIDELNDAVPREHPRLWHRRGTSIPLAAALPSTTPAPAGEKLLPDSVAGGFRLGGGESRAAAPVSPESRGGAYSGPVGRRVITTVLVDAINPQYADRVEPMVAVLWELLQDPSIEKQPGFGPIVAGPPPGTDPNNDPRMREPKPKPKGPQDR